MENILEIFSQIKAFIFDIDGVLTNGQVLVTEEGHMLRSMNIKDGYALQHAVKQGYPIAIISGGKGSGILDRLRGLGIQYIYLGQSHKMEAFEEACETWNLQPHQIAYMGDDFPDIPVLQKVGLPCCPADACQEVKNIAQYIASAKGGYGCARELIEQVMKTHGTWISENSHHW
ncbi:MAG: KdsC family phosphatase [Bacteroidota bacterium]|jgi:3-deoxy-D-manno-octulosonate 8-phosphate phosphatase (KDO 8-P phosphatase)